MKRDDQGEKSFGVIGIHCVARTLVYFPECSRSLTTSSVGCFVELRRNTRTLMGPLIGDGTCSIRCDSISTSELG